MNKIHHTAVIASNVSLGDNVTIGPYVVIGSPGFCFDRTQKPPKREEFKGSVVIGDNVEIGALCNIDQGRVVTVLENGCKIDAMCHIAHDCHIGENAILAAGTILGGHAYVGAGARIGLNATLRNRSHVHPGAVVGMHTGVIHRVDVKKTMNS